MLLAFESSLYSAVTPVLPHYAHTLHASKPALGLLSAAYPAGLIPGSLLGGWIASRVGVRRTTLAGLIFFGVAVAAFGFATDLVALDAARGPGPVLRPDLGWRPHLGDRGLGARAPRRHDRRGDRRGDVRHAGRAAAGDGRGGDRHPSGVLRARRPLVRPGRPDAPPPRAGPHRQRGHRASPAAGRAAHRRPAARHLADHARGDDDRRHQRPAAAAPVALRRLGGGDRCHLRGRGGAQQRAVAGRRTGERSPRRPAAPRDRAGSQRRAGEHARAPAHGGRARAADRDRPRRPAGRLHDPGGVDDDPVRRGGRHRARRRDDARQPRLRHGRDDRRPGRRRALAGHQRRGPAPPAGRVDARHAMAGQPDPEERGPAPRASPPPVSPRRAPRSRRGRRAPRRPRRARAAPRACRARRSAPCRAPRSGRRRARSRAGGRS